MGQEQNYRNSPCLGLERMQLPVRRRGPSMTCRMYAFIVRCTALTRPVKTPRPRSSRGVLADGGTVASVMRVPLTLMS